MPHNSSLFILLCLYLPAFLTVSILLCSPPPPPCRGENVEEAFLEAAKRIYQNIQDGSLDLNAAESGVQHKPSAPQGGRLNADSQPAKEGCSC